MPKSNNMRSFDWRGLVSSSGGACLLSVSSRGVAFRQVERRVSSAFRREE